MSDTVFKVGDIVIALKGPHKGVKHKVIHCFDDGSCNVQPIGLSPNRIRYSLGAAKAQPEDLQMATNETDYNKDAVDKEIKKAGVGKKGAKNIHRLLKGHSGKKDEVSEASELKTFKVTYKTKKGETTVTVKARDENEAKARVRRRDNYQGNAVAQLQESNEEKKYNVQTRSGKKIDTITASNAGEAMRKATKKHGRKHGEGKENLLSVIPVKESKLNEGVLDDQDDDGFMAKRQLYDLAKYAVELHRMIQDTDDLEPWVQTKITKAADYIDTVKHYLEYNNVRDAEAAADVMGPPEMDDIDAVGNELNTMLSMETEVMEYGDEDEGSEVHPEDVLFWAVRRGIITPEQEDQAQIDPSSQLMMAAQDVADSIGRVWEIGSSDVSIWMRQFIDICKAYGIKCDGPKAHLYESQLKAKMIYRNMLRELREKK